VWADYRPEYLQSALAVQNERTGALEGHLNGEDVIFPHQSPTLEWIQTTPGTYNESVHTTHFNIIHIFA